MVEAGAEAIFDLVIRGGLLFDGSGGQPFVADVGVRGGLIAAIGSDLGAGREEIDAAGRIVTPGFVDIHTHYDGQVTWSHNVDPSSDNGVTTVLIGNCGVGFAPCRAEQRDMLVELMEGVEDIPEVVLTEGLPWAWESYPEYLDFLDRRSYDLDIASQVPHAALRVFVMGERGAAREPATAADRARMAELVAEGIGAGALGFSTSRSLNHKTLGGDITPSYGSAEAELIEIGAAMESGWIQVISDYDDREDEFAMLRRICEKSGRRLTTQLLQTRSRPDHWKWLLDKIAAARKDGLDIVGQVMGRPIGIILGFETSRNPFMDKPTYRKLAKLPFDERMAELRRPEVREAILAEESVPPFSQDWPQYWHMMFSIGERPDYEPAPENSLAARAARAGLDPAQLCYDELLKDGGRAMIYCAMVNYADGDLEAVAEMIEHSGTILGLSDGGAHVAVICDASAPTTTLTHWARDRTRGPKMELSFLIRLLTRDCAMAVGLEDRGLLAEGLKADINVIDFEHLGVTRPTVVYDLPAGGKRLAQPGAGYVATIVSGVPVRVDGKRTGAQPGRLVRGVKADPREPRGAMADAAA
jgi:N-acyl-D-aspartate/D-glutamate deacylase